MVSSVSGIVSNGQNPLQIWAETQDKKRMESLQKKSQDGTISKLENAELYTRKVAEAFKNLSSTQISFGANKSNSTSILTEYNIDLPKEVIEKGVQKRVEQGLKPEMAKEILAHPHWAQTFLFTDNDGNYIYPNVLLNDLSNRGFHYTMDEHGFPTYCLKNGDCVHIGYRERSSKALSERVGKDVKYYYLEVKNDSPTAVPKEEYTVCTNWKDGKSECQYIKYVKTSFGEHSVVLHYDLENLQKF